MRLEIRAWPVIKHSNRNLRADLSRAEEGIRGMAIQLKENATSLPPVWVLTQLYEKGIKPAIPSQGQDRTVLFSSAVGAAHYAGGFWPSVPLLPLIIPIRPSLLWGQREHQLSLQGNTAQTHYRDDQRGPRYSALIYTLPNCEILWMLHTAICACLALIIQGHSM